MLAYFWHTILCLDKTETWNIYGNERRICFYFGKGWNKTLELNALPIFYCCPFSSCLNSNKTVSVTFLLTFLKKKKYTPGSPRVLATEISFTPSNVSPLTWEVVTEYLEWVKAIFLRELRLLLQELASKWVLTAWIWL